MTHHHFTDLHLKKLRLKRHYDTYRLFSDEKNYVDIKAESAMEAIELSIIKNPVKIVSLGFISMDKILEQCEVEVESDEEEKAEIVNTPQTSKADDKKPVAHPLPETEEKKTNN